MRSLSVFTHSENRGKLENCCMCNRKQLEFFTLTFLEFEFGAFFVSETTDTALTLASFGGLETLLAGSPFVVSFFLDLDVGSGPKASCI